MDLFRKTIICFLIVIVSMTNIMLAQTTNAINWKEDLEIYKASLEQKHIDVYHTITKDDFTNEWQKMYNNVESLSDFEIILKLMRLTRRINDGHTSVSLRNISTHRFPFEIEWIENRWYGVKSIDKKTNVHRLQVLKILRLIFYGGGVCF